MVVLLQTDLPRLSAAVPHVRRVVSKPCLHSERGEKKQVNRKSVGSKNVSITYRCRLVCLDNSLRECGDWRKTQTLSNAPMSASSYKRRAHVQCKKYYLWLFTPAQGKWKASWEKEPFDLFSSLFFVNICRTWKYQHTKTSWRHLYRKPFLVYVFFFSL